MYSSTARRTFYELVVTVFINVTLHRADNFCFGVTVYEETVIVMFICQVNHDILNP